MTEQFTAEQKQQIKEAVTSESGRKELQEIFLDRFNIGNFDVLYAEGKTINHIAIDFASLVTVCGKIAKSVSTTEIVTPKGELCRKCLAVYEEAFLVWLDGDHAPDVSDNISNVRKLIATVPDAWSRQLIGTRLG